MVEAHNVPLSEPTKPQDSDRTKTPFVFNQFRLAGLRTAIARIAEDHELEGSTVAAFEDENYLIHPAGDNEPTADFPFLVEYHYSEQEVPPKNGEEPEIQLKIVITSVRYACNEILEA